MACLIAVANFSHVDPAAEMRADSVAQQAFAQSQGYGAVTFMVPVKKAVDTGWTTAATEAVPTNGMILGRSVIPSAALPAIRRAMVPKETRATRLKSLND